jgi:hypothetical protein
MTTQGNLSSRKIALSAQIVLDRGAQGWHREIEFGDTEG